MNKAKKSIWFLLLMIALLAIPTFAVFAKELGMLTISGPGIKGELTLNDPKAMMDLEQKGFFDEATLSQPPKNLNLEGWLHGHVSPEPGRKSGSLRADGLLSHP
jgi:hypothetical protein